MPPNYVCEKKTNPCFGKGIWQMLRNLLSAAYRQGDVNHITGDVHYLTLALKKKRTLITIHDCVSLERLRGLKLFVFRMLWYSLPVRQAKMVTVISEATRVELLRHVKCDPAKVRVVHCCVNSEFSPHPKAFNESEPVLLQVGTGINKNLERVIVALAGFKCRLDIIGKLSPKQKSLLKQYQIIYSNIERATDREIVEAYQKCDVLIFASTYEGFGLPIVEANAVGRVVITSNLLSMPEVAGAAACLTDPFDPADIRAALVRVSTDSPYRDALIAAGFENVKRFTPNAIAKKYVELYQELLLAR